jgi:hypothetical protein
MSESTNKYIEENERVDNLPKIIAQCNKKKSYKIYSVRWALYKKIKFFRELAKYCLEIIVSFNFLIRTISLKKAKKNKKALVLGNGPSQGYLSENDLQRLKKSGIEIFAVNHFNENVNYKNIAPDYLVLSDSGTLNFSPENNALLEKNKLLLDYLNKHQDIKIICAALRIKNLSKILGKKRIMAAFIDSDFVGISNNISPIFPRGYCSMTLYKALANALWFGYREIYILGMDNTYPRNIYSNKNNNILNLEIHAGSPDYVADVSSFYECMGDLLVDISNIFYDAKKFSRESIINLDPYSLTDAFRKNSTIELKKFVEEMEK